MNEIEYTLFRDKHDLAPQRTKTTWSAFAETFREARRAHCSAASCRRHDCAHKEGHAWSPAVYPPGALCRRSLVEGSTLLVIDLDHLTSEQFAEAAASLAPYQRILHGSHSDRPTSDVRSSDRCVRAIVAISRPVTRHEWPRFWRAAMSQLKQPADPSCCDAGRIYYLPSRPKDEETYYFEAHDGIALDVDSTLAIHDDTPLATAAP